MEKNLKGKRILVSGGGGGSAAYWCKYLAEQGAHVLVNDVGYVQDESMGGDYNINLRTHESADNVVKAIRDAGGIAEADYEDVSEMNGAAHAVEHCLDVFGGVDILLNATCVSRLNECIDLTAEEWDIVIKNNLYPAFNLSKQVLPHMIKQQWGRLLYTTSAVIRSFWGSVNYAAAYAGVYSLMRCIANEVRPDHITANCIEPSAAGKTGRRSSGVEYLERRMRALGLSEDAGKKIVDTTPPASALSPFIAYLCTEEASNITGQNFALCGGRYGIYGTLEEKRYIYKAPSMGDWTVEELKEIMPHTLEQDMTKLWYSRN